MICTLFPLVLLVANPEPSRSAASDSPPSKTEVIVLRRCGTEYERSSMLGATGSGILQDCVVRLGDPVRAGQVLGRLQDKEARAEMAVREAQAASDVEIRLNEAKHEQVLAKLKITDSLRRRNFSSAEEYAAQRLEATVAELAIDEAKFRRQLARLQADQAAAAVRTREIVAPHDGVVIAVFKKPGESVSLDAPVFHVVDYHRVLATGYLDVDKAWHVQSGQSARVVPSIGGVDLAIEQEVFPARIVFVDRIVDPRTQTCKVVAEIENHEGRLRAGLPVRLEIFPVGVGVADGIAVPPVREATRRVSDGSAIGID